MDQGESEQHSVAVEDYLKQIWKLQGSGERASTKAISERLGLERGTVSGMLKQLASRGLIEHEPYRGAQLSDEGQKLALRMIRRHRLIELFLSKSLGLDWHEVHEDAERLEHAVSDVLIDRIDEYLGRPEVDPHGAPIPSAEGQLDRQDFEPLAEMEAGDAVVVKRVSDSDPAFLKHLDDLGISLGVELRVIAMEPFGAMRVAIADREAQLTREATERIHVSR